MSPVHSSALELPFRHSIERTTVLEEAFAGDELEEENWELLSDDDDDEIGDDDDPSIIGNC